MCALACVPLYWCVFEALSLFMRFCGKRLVLAAALSAMAPAAWSGPAADAAQAPATWTSGLNAHEHVHVKHTRTHTHTLYGRVTGQESGLDCVLCIDAKGCLWKA